MQHIDNLEIVERYIILLLGAESNPIPSEIHIQKELFVLSKIKPVIQNFLNFEKHYKGPYSQILQETVKEPFHYSSAYIFDGDKISITKDGNKVYGEILNAYNKDPKFLELVQAMRLVRDIYDKLSPDELLFLVYATYPEYIEFSDIYDKLFKNTKRRSQILKSLLEKNLITDKRYRELLNNNG